MESKIVKYLEVESKMVVAMGWGGENGKVLVKGDEFQLCKINKFWRSTVTRFSGRATASLFLASAESRETLPSGQMNPSDPTT